jgi:hypothetical protein
MNPLDLVPDNPLAPDPVAVAGEELAAGRTVLLRDDCERRGEGDLLIAAEFADAAAINFMATEARGLVCVALSTERCERLGLEQIGNRPRRAGRGGARRAVRRHRRDRRRARRGGGAPRPHAPAPLAGKAIRPRAAKAAS